MRRHRAGVRGGQYRVIQALDACPLVVCNELFLSETARHADAVGRTADPVAAGPVLQARNCVPGRARRPRPAPRRPGRGHFPKLFEQIASLAGALILTSIVYDIAPTAPPARRKVRGYVLCEDGRAYRLFHEDPHEVGPRVQCLGVLPGFMPPHRRACADCGTGGSA